MKNTVSTNVKDECKIMNINKYVFTVVYLSRGGDLTPQLILGYIHFANAEFCLLCSSSTFDNYCCAAGRHAYQEEAGSNNTHAANQYGRRGAHSYCTLQ